MEAAVKGTRTTSCQDHAYPGEFTCPVCIWYCQVCVAYTPTLHAHPTHPPYTPCRSGCVGFKPRAVSASMYATMSPARRRWDDALAHVRWQLQQDKPSK